MTYFDATVDPSVADMYGEYGADETATTEESVPEGSGIAAPVSDVPQVQSDLDANDQQLSAPTGELSNMDFFTGHNDFLNQIQNFEVGQLGNEATPGYAGTDMLQQGDSMPNPMANAAGYNPNMIPEGESI